MKKNIVERVMQFIFLLTGFGVCLQVCGCAANAARMVPTEFEVVNKHPYTVRVNESVGGRETNPLWTSQISNSAFTSALGDALAQSGVFRGVIKGEGADYVLDVTILHYDQPIIGLDLDVKIKSKWELTEAKTFKSVWSDTFDTTYRAKMSDALIAAERLQKANEGAARNCIKEGIKRISMLKL